MWQVILVDEVENWYLRLCVDAQHLAERVTAAIDLLAEQGPHLGRPVVDSTSGSKIHNMKEIRAESTRILFVFDPTRTAVLLVAGDKAGNWSSWYRTNIPIAEWRYGRWLNGNYGKEGVEQ